MNIIRLTNTDHTTQEGIIFLEQNKQSWGIESGLSESPLFIQIEAKEDIIKHSIIKNDGLAASSLVTNDRMKILGIATENTVTGMPITVQVYGEMINDLWNWGSLYGIFLNGAAISETPPVVGFRKRLGQIKNANTIFIDLQESILL